MTDEVQAALDSMLACWEEGLEHVKVALGLIAEFNDRVEGELAMMLVAREKGAQHLRRAIKALGDERVRRAPPEGRPAGVESASATADAD